MKRIIFLLAGGFILAVPATSNGQLLKKLKEKANSAVNKAIEGKTGNETQENPNSSSSSSESASQSGSNRPVNKGGAGLKNTAPPDVNVR